MNAPVADAKEQRQSSLLAIMAAKYNMDAATFASTVRKTAMPSNATNEEFAAFMMVAKEYNLNPILKEIHAFPKKGGGIQPVVSIDGWVSLINQHPQLDGYTFEWFNDDKGRLLSCRCSMYRKDRKHPVTVEEYLMENIRQTDPWKMEHRMLRHRALIQAARYAFGFSGIMDEDEAETIRAMRDVTPPPARKPMRSDFIEGPKVEADAETGEIKDSDGAPKPGPSDEGKAGAVDPIDAPANPTPEQRGAADRDTGKSLHSVPDEWRGEAQAENAERWSFGWRERDKELMKTKAAT